MPFNGSGVFVRLYNFVNDAAANIKIRADRMDNEFNGVSTALSLCITRDGQSTAQANLPMATFKHTGVGDATLRNQYFAAGQAVDGLINWAVASGTSDAITASYTIPISALKDGQECYVRASAANATTTPTFSPDGITARTITQTGGNALAVGSIAGAGHELILKYKLASTRWELLNPAPVGYPTISGTNAFTGANSFSNTTTYTGLITTSKAINEAQGADIASATTTDIGAATGNYVKVTGTTTITGLGTIQAGTRRIVEFTGALLLTHNASSLILPTGANITTVAGDCATFESEGSGNWRCVQYQRASGDSLLPRKLVQHIYATDATKTTGTANIPLDDTIPQSGEGLQAITATITPTNASNKLVITATVNVSNTVSNETMIAALFQDSGANAIQVSTGYQSLGSVTVTITLRYEMVAGTTSSTTFKVRAAGQDSATVTLNGAAGNRLFGGVMAHTITIDEIAA